MSIPLRALANVVVALAVAPPPTTHPSLELAFQGTVISTYPDGRTALLWLDRDGGYKALGRRRTPSSGVWTVKAERICLKQRKPFYGPFSYCTLIPRGERATAKAVTGEPITVAVTPGGRDRAPSLP